MHEYTRAGSARAPRGRSSALRRPLGAALMAVSLLAASACSTDDILGVTDPDIINPEDVQSPAGADAVRLGALARFNTATSGGESLFLLGGLFADEWINGDSFIARQEIDQRVVTAENTFLTGANRSLHRARLSAEQAIDLMAEFRPSAPEWQVAEMELIQAYVINILAEHYCDGLIFSTVEDGEEVYGSPITTAEAFGRALGHADAGLGMTFGTDSMAQVILNALRVTKGRILLNLDQVANAAAAVTAVPTEFTYTMHHSPTTNQNQFWTFNNNARRYSVADNEGGNGMDFVSAGDPRVPTCHGGDAECEAIGVDNDERDDDGQPFHVQMLWPGEASSVTIMSGIHARLIEAEAELAANDPDGMITILNDLRATVAGLTDLVDPGTAAGRLDLLFRERAFWQFGRGTRVGDLRRLIRQYGLTEDQVFPTGAWHKSGNYGNDVNLPVPFTESNNPSPGAGACLNRNP